MCVCVCVGGGELNQWGLGGGEGGSWQEKSSNCFIIILKIILKIILIQLFWIFAIFEPLCNFRSNGKNFGVMNSNLTVKVRAEIERLIKSISSKQDALSHFYVKRELNPILCLPALCYLRRNRQNVLRSSASPLYLSCFCNNSYNLQ